NALVGQCRRHQLSAELVIVEWNPPADRPRLAQALRWPRENGPCRVRILEVPEHLHRRFRHADAMPLFQMIAKNVGIRRARGRFILATNIDVLMNDELVRFLASGALRPGQMYRIDRHDVLPDVPVAGPVDEQLRYCATHLLRRNTCEGTFPLTPAGEWDLFERDIAPRGEGITFETGWFPAEEGIDRPFRWAGPDAGIAVRQPAPAACLALEVAPGPGLGGGPLKIRILDDQGQVVARRTVRKPQEMMLPLPLHPGQTRRFRLRVAGGGFPRAVDQRILSYLVTRCCWRDQAPGFFLGGRGPRLLRAAFGSLGPGVARLQRGRGLGQLVRGVSGRVGHYLEQLWAECSPLFVPDWLYFALERQPPPPLLLHTNAAGDFTLMAREDWHRLRGHPEFESFSL